MYFIDENLRNILFWYKKYDNMKFSVRIFQYQYFQVAKNVISLNSKRKKPARSCRSKTMPTKLNNYEP